MTRLVAAFCGLALVAACAAQEPSEAIIVELNLPTAQTLTIAADASQEEVVDLLRENRVDFEGPVPVVQSELGGVRRVIGSRITIVERTLTEADAAEGYCPETRVVVLMFDRFDRLRKNYVYTPPRCQDVR